MDNKKKKFLSYVLMLFLSLNIDCVINCAEAAQLITPESVAQNVESFRQTTIKLRDFLASLRASQTPEQIKANLGQLDKNMENLRTIFMNALQKCFKETSDFYRKNSELHHEVVMKNERIKELKEDIAYYKEQLSSCKKQLKFLQSQ